jgi:hypothetical protein
MSDYEIIWSGDVRASHRGMLCVVPDAPKPAPMDADVNYAGPVTKQVQTLLVEWHTIPELASKLQVTQEAAENGLKYLRRAGLLEIVWTGNADVRKRYRLRVQTREAA